MRSGGFTPFHVFIDAPEALCPGAARQHISKEHRRAFFFPRVNNAAGHSAPHRRKAVTMGTV